MGQKRVNCEILSKMMNKERNEIMLQVGEEEAKSRSGNWYFLFPQKMLSFVYTILGQRKEIRAGYIFLVCKKLANITFIQMKLYPMAPSQKILAIQNIKEICKY